MENLYESYNFEQDIENFAIMDDKQDNERVNNIESRNEHEKYPFNSYQRVEQPDDFMSVKKFSNFFSECVNDDKIDETLFSSNYFSFDENKATETPRKHQEIEEFPMFYEFSSQLQNKD